MTETVNVQDAKTRLSELLKRVEAGEEITIARSGHPIARLIAASPPPERELGFARDLPDLDESFFFDPLPEEELAGWEGR